MKKCIYCGKELTGEYLQVGPERLGLNYCDKRCDVFNILKTYPDTSLADMVKEMYPEYAKEYFELMGAGK